MLPSGNALGHISDGMVVQEALMKRSNTVFYLLGLAKALFSYVRLQRRIPIERWLVWKNGSPEKFVEDRAVQFSEIISYTK